MKRVVAGVLVFAGGFLSGGWVGRFVTSEPHTVRPVQIRASLPETNTMPASGAMVHFPYRQMVEFTPDGAAAGAAMARTLADKTADGCNEARAIWARIMPTENFAGEYGALDWLCGYLTSPAATRAELSKNAEGRRLVAFFDRVGWRALTRYLQQRYTAHDQTEPGADAQPQPMSDPSQSLAELLFVHELLRFDGPQRPEWEHTDEVIGELGVKPGEFVVDVGSGHGFFSVRLSAVVGPGGKVYAAEIDKRYLAYLGETVRNEGITNVTLVEATPTDITLPADSVDTIFICNLYHELYGTMTEADRQAFLSSLHRALRPGGRLIISDNMPEAQVPAGHLTYHGFAIAPELIVLQLGGSGFRLDRRFAVIPQRYQLVFSET